MKVNWVELFHQFFQNDFISLEIAELFKEMNFHYDLVDEV